MSAVTRTRRSSLRRLVAAVTLSSAAVGITAVPSAAATTEFPHGWEGYHTYAEMTADIHAVEAAHPGIVHVFSIGKSYQGRAIWAAKVSDNVAIDENEPEVIYDGLHHSDEHMGAEMTLHILHWLADGYGRDARITKIVNTREIWIVFMVNPDGGEYDISGGRFHYWRKNRQPTPGSSYIGTDLNRNYDYRWGLDGRTSANPQAITYHGPSAFSAPETRAMRDFLASRVVNGRQQIRLGITFHEAGRLVMWPYGYTTTDVPGDMTVNDHSALAAIGRRMATTNGYRPQQASDLYITRGREADYAYGRYRIFSYTFEMSVVDYPDDSLIVSETGRNKEAVLYLAERAWCPYSILGTTVTAARCGAFDDDLEVGRGWTVNPDGTDTSPASARWARGNPAGTAYGGVTIQQGTVSSGSAALVTGLPAGTAPSAYDLDGRTTVRSPAITLPSAVGQHLTFRYVFAHDARATAGDRLQAIVEGQDGSRTAVFTQAGTARLVAGTWRSASIVLDRWAGQTIHVRFVAASGATTSLVEAEIDDVRVTRPA
ncbi:MAG: M14 family zinc carboxypeptidase [Chloroflexota bacterium]